MPTYVFKNSDTGETEEHFLKMSELDTFRTDNPHLTSVVTSSTIVRDSGSMKPDDGFRDVLKSIKKASGRGNNINTF
jgi:hypothetical protein